MAPGDGLEVQFRTAASRFQLIDDSQFQSVFVPYGSSPALIGRLTSTGRPERWLMRKLQRYSVNLPKPQFNRMLTRGDIKPLYGDSFFALVSQALYDESVGVILQPEDLAPNDLVV